MEITGIVKEVGETEAVTEKFQKRSLIIEYAENPQYPEFIKIEANQDKCNKLDELRPGDEVTVHFNLRGRPWTDKNGKTSYFNTLALWKFSVNKTAPNNLSSPVDISSNPDDDDDLPF